MAFSPLFSVSQQVGLDDTVTITDESTDSDVLIISRVIYLRKSIGGFFVPTGTTTDYVEWAYADVSKDVEDLDKDYAFQITVEWLDVDGVALYTATGIYGLTAYNEDFDYNLTSVLASNPLLVNDNSFRQNKSALRMYIDAGNQAISQASDIVSAQLCYDEATKIRIGSVYYFNESPS